MTRSLDELRVRAEAGNTVAQTILGITLFESRDYSEALRWLSLAADKGSPRALLHLGSIHEHGLGVPPDLSRAHSLYVKAADAGEFFACVFLGRLHASGSLGHIDKVNALRWYTAALHQEQTVAPSAELDEARAFVEANR